MRRAAQASRGGHVVRASRGSSSWCVALLVACCALVHTQALELPNWHPHRFRVRTPTPHKLRHETQQLVPAPSLHTQRDRIPSRRERSQDTG
jgi:hypothetical protein